VTSPDPAFSLVIPAYNESARLGATLAEVERWLADPPRAPAEVVLSDDGSEDDTLAVMRRWAETQAKGSVRVLANEHRGKAATVRSGILAAEGALILFSDADLSTPLAEAAPLIAAIEDGADVAIGSRELSGAQRESEPFYRHLMGRGFNYLVQALLVRGIRDTQCGFKMFRREAARAIFGRLRRYGADAPRVRGPMVTAFDVEVLFVARKLGYRITEVPVRWVHDEGSKVRPVVDSLRMFRDVALVKLGDLQGEYS
jgi:glycosyltransferase involved in cell wall biosynthesis